jgi:flagellar basal-body rod modification protein FlgD
MNVPTTALSALPDAAAPRERTTSLGKDDFLRLLTTQLRSQDPLSPMDSEAFVAQLAQASANQLSTASLVGKQVLHRTDRLTLAAGRPAELQVALDGPAASASLVISDPGGRVVRTLDLGAREGGAFTVAWDGRDAAGAPLPAGDYLVSVAAAGADGAPVPAASRARGIVTAVSFSGGAPQLLVGGAAVAMSEVVEISSPTP